MIEQAALSRERKVSDTNPATKWDVIVVGGGLAGLCTAVRCSELGLRPLVLERGKEAAYPCNFRYSGGIVHIVHCDPYRPPEVLKSIIQCAVGTDHSSAMADAIAEDGRRLIDWMRSLGIRFIRFGKSEAVRWGIAPPRPLRVGLDWKGRGPDVALRLLTTRLLELGGMLELGALAENLLMDGNRCLGVAGQGMGGTTQWLADHVVIADGGFQADARLFSRHLGTDFSRVLQRGAATGQGYGLRMAMAAGAAAIGLDKFYGHIHAREALSNERLWPYPDIDAIAGAGVVVNAAGIRITDESAGGIAIANALARLPDPTSCWVIFDSAIWNGPGRSARIPANPLLEGSGAAIIRANEIGNLATKIGCQASTLIETVETYNQALSTYSLESLQPPRKSGRAQSWPIQQKPFFAIALCPGITYTMGGIAIDGRARVLDTTGTPLPGLFAAGTTTGGLEGGNSAGYVGGIVQAGVFGLRAAETIARIKSSKQ